MDIVPVTVAIPSYNGEKYIAEAIFSVLGQTVCVEDVLVIDDNSYDKTVRIAADIAQANNKICIRIIESKANSSYAKNWNRAFEFCTQKYLVILHHDDVLKENAVETLLSFHSANPEYAVVGGQEDFIDVGGRIIQKKILSKNKLFELGKIYEFIKESSSYIACSSVMFDMDKIRNVGYFDEGVLATDELYWPRVLQYYPIAVLGKSLINRRIHDEQTEYDDFKNKKEQIVEWNSHFIKIIDYEKRELERSNLQKLVKKKSGLTYGVSITKSAIVRLRSPELGLFYLLNGVKIYPQLLIMPLFWKNLLYSLLVYFGILSSKP